jgi:hypothetical protein
MLLSKYKNRVIGSLMIILLTIPSIFIIKPSSLHATTIIKCAGDTGICVSLGNGSFVVGNKRTVIID